MSRAIEDYALLSNGQTAALLGRDGSIDWLCWPRFDDDACLAALLGTPENGCWELAPVEAVVRRDRRYQDDTLVMETDIETASGAVRIIDFMPVDDHINAVVRVVMGLRGVVRMRSKLRLRLDYGLVSPWLNEADGVVHACAGPDHVTLHATVRHSLQDGSIDAEFGVAQGEETAFVMTYQPAHEPSPRPLNASDALQSTLRYWRGWISQFDDSRTAWPHAVRRSLLTLKALTHRTTGAMVAAPTTSLPEAPGGSLNWDYRYSWLRDTCFALVALSNAGFNADAHAWRDWLVRAIAGSPAHIQIMYRVDGGRHLREWTVDWLAGYRYATPVRVGNAAATQEQVDVLGEIIDCLDVARRSGLPPSAEDDEIEARLIGRVQAQWNSPGAGIWESRSKPRHYTYSRVMAWVALDRFLSKRSAQTPASPLVERLASLKALIHEEVCREAWNEGLGAFTQYYGSQELDGSLLLMPLVGFLPADEPRMASTIERIRIDLSENGLVRRKQASADGPREGVFLACSCWMADCLQMQGRETEAREQFERVLAVANDLGLLAEQYDAQRRELIGNFPQALTHIAVVNTALGLCGPTLQRGGG
ncbi:glycoside hydrolase family 15 protein [Paraburkholderia sp.]|uniref:glycoside hydrolase family 15 protein n=1 Tax=Paraburkholderia sp. TaxID=1926495 RepID=UPI002F4238CD